MEKALFVVMGVVLAVSGVLFSLASTTGDAQAKGSPELESNVVGIPPSMTRSTPPPAPSDSLLRGVSAAGLPWTVAEGEVELDGSGELKVEVTGLVFSAGPFAGTTGPVTAVRASLTCEGVSGPVAITSPVPLSPEGDAEIEETITLPPTCVGPIVLVNLAALTGGPLPAPGFWIAATGF